jgi:hypothetical protein
MKAGTFMWRTIHDMQSALENLVTSAQPVSFLLVGVNVFQVTATVIGSASRSVTQSTSGVCGCPASLRAANQ